MWVWQLGSVTGNSMAATLTRQPFKQMREAVASQFGLQFELRDKQLDVMFTSLAQKRNVLAVLRTGFGKSECFGMATPLLNKVIT